MAKKEHKGSNQYSHLSLSGKERANSETTLICLIRGCIGLQTVIELRNETIVCGKILNCDGFMNLIVANALFQKATREEMYFEEIHILAKNIRYVHVPDKINIQETIETQLRNLSVSRETGSTTNRKRLGRGRGQRRGRGRGQSMDQGN